MNSFHVDTTGASIAAFTPDQKGDFLEEPKINELKTVMDVTFWMDS